AACPGRRPPRRRCCVAAVSRREADKHDGPRAARRRQNRPWGQVSLPSRNDKELTPKRNPAQGRAAEAKARASIDGAANLLASRKPQVSDVGRKEHSPGPLHEDPDLAPKRRHLRQIIRTPDEPCGEAGQLHSEDFGDAIHMADRRHRAERAMCKWPRWLPRKHAHQVCSEAAGFAYRELRSRRSRSPVVSVRYIRAVANGP